MKDGLSFHRALCKRVDCATCNGMTEPVHIQAWVDTFNSFFFDSTIQPGRQVTREWDFDTFAKEWAADD